MLRYLGIDFLLVNKRTLTPFNAADVRIDISWYVSVFAGREFGARSLALAGRSPRLPLDRAMIRLMSQF